MVYFIACRFFSLFFFWFLSFSFFELKRRKLKEENHTIHYIYANRYKANSHLKTMKKDITTPNTCQVVMDDNIPEEEILERLPVKSLIRLKSVSKQWKSMIESSYLAKKRLARFPNPKLLVIRSETSMDESSRTLLLEIISKEHHHHNKKKYLFLQISISEKRIFF